MNQSDSAQDDLQIKTQIHIDRERLFPGQTLTKVAKTLDIPASVLSRLERGKTEAPSERTRRALEQAGLWPASGSEVAHFTTSKGGGIPRGAVRLGANVAQRTLRVATSLSIRAAPAALAAMQSPNPNSPTQYCFGKRADGEFDWTGQLRLENYRALCGSAGSFPRNFGVRELTQLLREGQVDCLIAASRNYKDLLNRELIPIARVLNFPGRTQMCLIYKRGSLAEKIHHGFVNQGIRSPKVTYVLRALLAHSKELGAKLWVPMLYPQRATSEEGAVSLDKSFRKMAEFPSLFESKAYPVNPDDPAILVEEAKRAWEENDMLLILWAEPFLSRLIELLQPSDLARAQTQSSSIPNIATEAHRGLPLYDMMVAWDSPVWQWTSIDMMVTRDLAPEKLDSLRSLCRQMELTSARLRHGFAELDLGVQENLQNPDIKTICSLFGVSELIAARNLSRMDLSFLFYPAYDEIFQGR